MVKIAHKKRGFLLPILFLTFAGVLVYSTLVLYQASMAYLSARLEYARMYKKQQ